MPHRQETMDLTDTEIMLQQLTAHEKVLQSFKDLPKDLKKHTQKFFKSQKPQKFCKECECFFYELSDMNNEQGYMCWPCLKFYEEEEERYEAHNRFVNGHAP